ncbi:hydroxyethylthiazole kinase-like uncharacterized protein yjeF [Sphingomonas vulcanisoli]|uniref:Bifunctional NAD(P)H-hydrate repair enzyme n=1 Tax=Sphingomonas vulcanisoli TaxID=1658060 RepID=A0ABX0TQ05_9SPHN|nr:NAD(P)H-hydrate dehydratase [Sphingomonas vulcanisoli]NIJ06477.1 hydroxyethylthiazole kinase-like uncharacterized protein yjeF [Sphingomonas vulcanisoli]
MSASHYWPQLEGIEQTAVLTAAETRAAEQALFDGGIAPIDLMEQAGQAAAAIIAERFAGRTMLVACGPGNNGGDGYVIARALAERGFVVRVVALADPRTDSAKAMRARWTGPVEAIAGVAEPAEVAIDALFGSGQTRALAPDLAQWLRAAGKQRIAIDLPSGTVTDTGAAEGDLPNNALTIAIGALKPAHLLLPAATLSDRTVLAPIDLPIPADHKLHLVTPPPLRDPHPGDNKYTRGKVVVIGGAMAGAAHLSAIAAMRSGAGYVELALDQTETATPYALVRRLWNETVLADARISAIAIGPGLDDSAESRAKLEAVLAVDRPAVLDAGALALLKTIGLDALKRVAAPRVLTPHEGEFARLFGRIGNDRLAAVRKAAETSGAIVLLKGGSTVIAAPDGRAAITEIAPPWLATAGTGDVLTGIVATMLAQMPVHGFDAFAAVQAAVWLHIRAAERAGPVLIADDLLFALKTTVAKA